MFGFGGLALFAPAHHHLLAPLVLLPQLVVECRPKDPLLLGLPQGKQPVVDPDVPLFLCG